ncbi:hypothetical protein [Actinomadura flavalba]|uniref:hypothetical protein n=1 Tax=Actinomadura flavalba TaxID=1120938 RepID=UPI000363CC56|nr:hypothetical protein [Actinomadura flavalba]
MREIVRDLVLLAVGSFGILWQQITGDYNVTLLIVFTGMVGVPGGQGLLRLVLRAAAVEAEQQQSVPGSPSSPPPSPPGAPGP